MPSYVIKIKEFTVKNFRCFKEKTIPFDAQNYACFVGKNGTGKTSILEAINLCLSEHGSKFTKLKETDFYSEDPIELTIKFDNPFFFSYEVGDGTNELVPCWEFTKTITRRTIKERGSFFSPPYDIKFDYVIRDYLPTNAHFDALKAKISGIVPTNSKLVRNFKKVEGEEGHEYVYAIQTRPEDFRPIYTLGFKYMPKELFPKVFYFDRNRSRELLTEYNTTFANILLELDWRFKKKMLAMENDEKDQLHTEYSGLSEKLRRLEDYKSKLVDPVIKRVQEDLGVAMDGKETEFFFFNFYSPYQNSVFGHQSNEKQIVPVTNYGSGISSLIALMFLVEYAKETKEGIIVLIDEPEIHLHADLQKNLKKFLKSSDFQTIASTHSHLFLDTNVFTNNYCFQTASDGSIDISPCNQLEVSDAQFRLLGNSLDDLHVPDNLILVEGEFDKLVLSKALVLRGQSDFSLHILDCGGYREIPSKADRYNNVFTSILGASSKFANYLKQNLRIIVDGDVTAAIVSGWKTRFSLTDDRVKHLTASQKGMEYLYPESVIRECILTTELDGGVLLSTLTKDKILEIILDDDDLKDKSRCKQKVNRVSKHRLNKFVAEKLTLEILNAGESSDLKAVVDWITGGAPVAATH